MYGSEESIRLKGIPIWREKLELEFRLYEEFEHTSELVDM